MAYKTFVTLMLLSLLASSALVQAPGAAPTAAPTKSPASPTPSPTKAATPPTASAQAPTVAPPVSAPTTSPPASSPSKVTAAAPTGLAPTSSPPAPLGPSAGVSAGEAAVSEGGGLKLFVFGDSYADTGNFEAVKRPGNPFNYPLGMTWPGKPAGRPSDGYVLTDILALFLNTSAPPTYSLWEKNSSAAESELKNGMNFAFGGSGALTTWENVTLSVQLRQFKQLVESMVFTPSDLQDSVAVLSSVGNDWGYFFAINNRSVVGGEDYMKKVRTSILEFLEELSEMGIKKVLTNLVITSNISVLDNHNKLLKEEIDAFAKRDCMKMVVLDYDNLLDAAKAMYDQEKGNTDDDCCRLLPQYVSNYTMFCGDKDESGNKVYTLCQDPAQYFHFSRGHLSHDGWKKMNTVFLESKILDPLRS
ncbi:hypothetical protein Tsubulata_021506 [Turnera subulata]|uniref:SGNH hydrolase-type esterase domain-containing protein n=1 Tax=Turnera subulata TaxID=218843 RepID=A0A9Q0FFT6_9ROSI|nr:hypothetical protein Tsubulata_021506 [Turnera subulata]